MNGSRRMMSIVKQAGVIVERHAVVSAVFSG
jgi:hypothetical protein